MLTKRQKEFCKEYIIDYNATRAAKAAGYSKSTARFIACENLTKPNIQAELDRLTKKRNERLEINQDYVLKNVLEVQQRCMQHKPVMAFDRSTKEYTQVVDDNGAAVWEFDAANATKALDMLAKHTGFYEADNNQAKPSLQIFVN